jgi:osmoprotectant transport system ATP-binding protein
MIEIRELTKRFPGAAHPAVDRLTLAVPEGAVCVLIGPSGCGKTTTMRIINRMIEPDAGTVIVNGRNVMDVDPVTLRRHIGYVIQQIGLFPHWSIADNIATVPQLLGWDERRIAARVDDLLALVGMDPATYRHRFPRELSGGQKQRVGVARALAADPPVMLMDEPFGAVDPIVRARLQLEFRAILRGLRKTVIFVTHDIDEAIRMGDLIAIMKDGALVQCDPPERILAAPKDAFIAEFVGADRALKRLALITAGAAAQPGAAPPGAPVVLPATSLRDVLSALLASGADVAAVTDADGAPHGSISLAAIRERASAV